MDGWMDGQTSLYGKHVKLKQTSRENSIGLLKLSLKQFLPDGVMQLFNSFCLYPEDCPIRSNVFNSVGELYLDIGLLTLDPWLSINVGPWQEAQAGQVMLKASVQLCLHRPEFPASGAAVVSLGAQRCGLAVDRDVSQFGELSGDGLLSDVILPRQAWKEVMMRSLTDRLDNKINPQLKHYNGKWWRDVIPLCFVDGKEFHELWTTRHHHSKSWDLKATLP